MEYVVGYQQHILWDALNEKKTGWKENGSTSGPKSDLFCLSAFACLELTYERVSQECYAQVVLLQ